MVAYTEEFNDPTHLNQTACARGVCRHQGIRDHRIIRLTLDAFTHEIPDTVWPAESRTYWLKAFMLLAAKHMRADGFDKVLSGISIGMDTLRNIGQAREHHVWRALLERYWRLALMAAPGCQRTTASRIGAAQPTINVPAGRIYRRG